MKSLYEVLQPREYISTAHICCSHFLSSLLQLPTSHIPPLHFASFLSSIFLSARKRYSFWFSTPLKTLICHPAKNYNLPGASTRPTADFSVMSSPSHWEFSCDPLRAKTLTPVWNMQENYNSRTETIIVTWEIKSHRSWISLEAFLITTGSNRTYHSQASWWKIILMTDLFCHFCQCYEDYRSARVTGDLLYESKG